MHSIVNLLQKVPLFQDFSELELENMAPLFAVRSYKKGTVLFFEGDLGEELFLVHTGVVKISRLENSKEVTLALFRSGDFFGDMAIIRKGLTRSATAETMEDATLYQLSRTDFFKFLEVSPSLCLKLLEVTMDRLRRANEVIHDITLLDVRSRIMKTILRLAVEYGTENEEGILINVKLTHQQIANIVGTVRESVTKVLQELQDDNVIVIRKKMILVQDQEALQQKICYL
ncbi:Crp/Fnr family transcriptional regulator [Paenibacillus sp. y28]